VAALRKSDCDADPASSTDAASSTPDVTLTGHTAHHGEQELLPIIDAVCVGLLNTVAPSSLVMGKWIVPMESIAPGLGTCADFLALFSLLPCPRSWSDGKGRA